MVVKKYKSIVTSISKRIPGIYTLEFKSLGGKYKYYPGQFLHLALDEHYDDSLQWPESRCFSMQSNPEEDNIRITYGVKGRFTTMMEQKLKVDSEVWVKLPYGDLFSRTHNKINPVFIAGGTGITPFLSLFTHKFFKEYLNPRIYIGFRSRKYNIYEKELASVKPYNPKIIYDDSEGRLEIQQILEENGPDHDYFISGPPDMIKYFKNYLISAGVSQMQVKTDDWE